MPNSSVSRPILLIEDDPDIPRLLEIHLRDLGCVVEHASDGDDGLAKATEGHHQLIILDLMLPGIDGLEVCRQLRALGRTTPILMLTARSEEIDKVLGLEIGADDYLTKPFSIRELIARVKALLRRSDGDYAAQPHPSLTGELSIGDLRIDLDGRRAMVRDREIKLTAKEFELLAFMAQRAGRAFDRQELLNHVWGYHYSGYEHTVNSHINRLRSKVEQTPSEPKLILTVWGHGYRFVTAEEFDHGH
jgi:two-component system, OmpR family, alkaline phosphatase synthesis response regulator PhoP